MGSTIPKALFPNWGAIFLKTLGVFVALVISSGGVFAETKTMSAQEAHSAALNKSLIILDIRSHGEWAETGVAQGAWPVTMHDQSFGANLQRIIGRFPDKPLALICATGGRSNYVAGILEANGLPGVIDISEGMFGNGASPGWIARDLPIVDVAIAHEKYNASMLGVD
jgi:rhodanese-related sulfurtransferase